MVNRSQRAAIAAETVAILERGTYISPRGTEVSIADALVHAVTGTRLYESGEQIREAAVTPATSRRLQIDVLNTTTLAASKSLVEQVPARPVACLNFASAKNPGGGFLGGSQAQEESLARSSGLYACLLAAPRYYEANRACGTCLYTDHMIYSPDVPVFRDDEGVLLEHPYLVSMVTAPAVNLGALTQNARAERSQNEEVMRRRIANVLLLAVAQGHRVLVLGAWGCGAFRNDPVLIARLFQEQLQEASPFHPQLDHVMFAVLDHSASQEIITPFYTQFTQASV